MATPALKPAGQQVRAKIQAKAAADKKFVTLRRLAATQPQEVHAALASLERDFAMVHRAFSKMRTNLDLFDIPKTASLKDRIALKRRYAQRLKKVAEEAPQEIGNAMNEVYQAIDTLAEDMENLADNMGLSLEPAAAEGGMPGDELGGLGEEVPPVAEPAVEQEVAEHIEDEAEIEGEPAAEELDEHAEGEEHEASGSDWFVTDRDEQGNPKAPVVASRRRPVVKTR